MFRAVVSVVTLAVVGAFAPSLTRGVSRSLKMSVFPENASGLAAGEVAPTGYFDPAGLALGGGIFNPAATDKGIIKQWREAEIKHGRVCMLAAVGLLTQEITTNPLGIDGPAIRHFDLVDEKFPEFGELFILLCAFIEGWSITNKWESKKDSTAAGRAGRLKPDSVPGDLNFDPLGWYPSDPAEQVVIQTKEISNGRLAMLGVAGIVAQELIDGKEVLCHFQKVCV